MKWSEELSECKNISGIVYKIELPWIEIVGENNFKYKKCNDGRQFLVERSDIVVARVKFLRKVNEFRRNGDTRPVVYLGLR